MPDQCHLFQIACNLCSGCCCTGFSACNCLFDSRNCLLASLILGLYYKLNWPKRACAVYWLLETLLTPGSRSDDWCDPGEWWYLWQGSRMRLGVTAKVGRNWKWSNGVQKSEMGIFWCVSITNNVESCKKFNEKAQTAKFSVLAMGRRPRQELFAKNMEN